MKLMSAAGGLEIRTRILEQLSLPVLGYTRHLMLGFGCLWHLV